MIINSPKIDESHINGLRSAIEHRATWFYLLLEEAKKSNVDAEKMGRNAIYRCGCFHGDEKMKKNCHDPEDLREFIKVFADANGQKVFEMEIVENTEDKMYLDFHYCPLVAAWRKLGISEEEIPLLCDIAMDGDRGIVSRFEGYEFRLESAIAKGDPVCKIRVEKK